jgi:hypothetical protein
MTPVIVKTRQRIFLIISSELIYNLLTAGRHHNGAERRQAQFQNAKLRVEENKAGSRKGTVQRI